MQSENSHDFEVRSQELHVDHVMYEVCCFAVHLGPDIHAGHFGALFLLDGGSCATVMMAKNFCC